MKKQINQKTKNKPRMDRVPNDTSGAALNNSIARVNGTQPLKFNLGDEFKFKDTPIGISASTVGNVVDLTSIAQGVGVSAREGDAIELVELLLNFNLVTQNADIFTTTRVIIFQWIPNDATVAPALGNVMQNSASTTPFYNWQGAEEYRILHDETFYLSGTTTAPTNSGLQGRTGQVISLAPAKKRVLFTAGAATGSCKLFMLIWSDSLVAPFPSYIGTTRLKYRD